MATLQALISTAIGKIVHSAVLTSAVCIRTFPFWCLAGLMLETALGADLERFGNAQLQLLKHTPAQGSLLPDGRAEPNAKATAATPAAAPAPAAVSPAAPAPAVAAAGSNAAPAVVEAGGLATAPSGTPEAGAAGSKPSFAAHMLLHTSGHEQCTKTLLDDEHG